ncbi:uncharacterized protein [Parasteatoda tepidariorum]|uniref:uncharacterized protein n=1 Tax=Parasteatoda tepidariorum TaxID=114398 RepID=UPI00077FCD8C|nr:uncharacterized serine-rich protein C215.13-like [Parasteatoda tepidariorum]
MESGSVGWLFNSCPHSSLVRPSLSQTTSITFAEMGLRRLPIICIVSLALVILTEGALPRARRQVPQNLEHNAYQPPFLVSTPAPSNFYHPPISFGDLSKAEPAVPLHLQPNNNNQAFGLHQVSGDSHSKAISYVPVQAINKAPASEIQSKSPSPAKEKDAAKDEYVVYYYYYYDNDTTPNTNLSFDDIPSLESYDEDRIAKEKNNANSKPIHSDAVIAGGNRLNSDLSDVSSSSSQARSASGIDKESVISLDKSSGDSFAPTHKPISNVYRYGANEVPKYPVVPNFIIAETTTEAKPTDAVTPIPVSSIAHATTQSTSFNAAFANVGNNEEDVSNNVLDSALESKSFEENSGTEDSVTTTVKPEAPTTIETTTITPTEKSSRRRPPIANGRRRFNASPSSFSSTRTRAPARDASSSTTTTTTSTSAAPTRRSFQGSNRSRSRPSVGGSRGRTRTTESNNIESSSSSSSASESTTVSTTTARARFTSAPRRFQSSRSRSQTSSTSTSRPSSSSTSASPVRSRPTSRRPSSNLLSRSRPARPGFPRSRAPEPEVPETTTPEAEETSPVVVKEEVAPEKETTSEEEEEESVEPTTTEASRFSALFKPRNRNALGNRPRPVAGNRPSRS